MDINIELECTESIMPHREINDFIRRLRKRARKQGSNFKYSLKVFSIETGNFKTKKSRPE